jgi:hypothetical protein
MKRMSVKKGVTQSSGSFGKAKQGRRVQLACFQIGLVDANRREHGQILGVAYVEKPIQVPFRPVHLMARLTPFHSTGLSDLSI